MVRRLFAQLHDQLTEIGFDDADFAPYTHPPLTTVRQPIVQIGREMARHAARRA